MKKQSILITILISTMLITSCGKDQKKSATTETESIKATTSDKTNDTIHLINKMTDTEKARVDMHDLTLLDQAPKSTKKKEHTVSVEFETRTKESALQELKESRKYMTDKEYKQSYKNIKNSKGIYPYEYIKYILVDGKIPYYQIPDEHYEGGEYTLTMTKTDENGETVFDENGKAVFDEKKFKNFDEYLEYIKSDLKEKYSCTDAEAENGAEQIVAAHKALVNKSYKVLPKGTVDPEDPDYYSIKDPDADYRDQWEYDKESVEKIRDSIREISIYDEEMDVEFQAEVTLPADYDNNKTYPVILLTDGVYRFGNCPEMKAAMDNGESSDVILVALSYSYKLNGRDEENRFNHLILKRKELDDFITDNLMPYLGENFNIDYTNSTLYGHSNGGVFAHYAMFNSDLYENQPFGKYIIGSPAFWCLYEDPDTLNLEGYLNDYSYFDRNTELKKSVFLCGGSKEDPDYADRYNGNPSTLEGLKNLNKRLKTHGADVTYKLYESHHWQYIPDMLLEYQKDTYPTK